MVDMQKGQANRKESGIADGLLWLKAPQSVILSLPMMEEDRYVLTTLIGSLDVLVEFRPNHAYWGLTYSIDNMASQIDRLFGSKTRVALLSEATMRPERTFYIRELSRELSIPYSMVHKEVKNLVSLGILSEEKKGKVTLVSLNKNLWYASELKGLLRKTAGLAHLLRANLSRAEDLQYALIYGSFASGEDSESSDVDLLAVGEVKEEAFLKSVRDAEEKSGREINYILWGKKEFARRAREGHHLLKDITSKPVIMLAGDEDEFRRSVKR